MSTRSYSLCPTFSLRRTKRKHVSILTLPTEIIHRILLDVCANSFGDLCRAKACCKTFRDVADDDFFLREIDLFTMKTPHHKGVDALKMKCLERGNLSALFLRGTCEYFRKSNLEDGINMIRIAACGRYDLAIYAYAIIKRIMSDGDGIDTDMINLNREFVSRMRRKVKSIDVYGWLYDIPEPFSKRWDLIPMKNLYTCKCCDYNPWVEPHNEMFKYPQMCDSCFWIIQTLGFAEEFPDRVLEWPKQTN